MTAIPVFFPPRLWPSRYQYLLMGGVVLLTAALLGVAVYRAGFGLDAAQTGLQGAEAELATLRAHVAAANNAQTTSAQVPADLPPLPSSSMVDSVVRDMTALAQRRNLTLASLNIESTAKSAQELAQRQISVQVRGSYAELKSWMGEMLARYPWLAIKSLNWRSNEQGASSMGSMAFNPAPLDVTVVWVLYVQD